MRRLPVVSVYSGLDHQETQFAIANLGNILLAQKRYAEAESKFRQALEGEIRILGEQHPEIAYAWYNIATVEAAQGKRANALTDLHRAIDHGYYDTDEISQDEAWNALRKDPAYQAAVTRMRKQQPSRKGWITNTGETALIHLHPRHRGVVHVVVSLVVIVH